MRLGILILILGTASFSCTSTRDLVYFNGVKDKTFSNAIKPDNVVIVPGDILNVHISSLNQEASEIFNQNVNSQIRSTTATGTNVERGGYLVDDEGYIQLPVLGKVKAAGVTKDALRTNITSQLLSQKLLKDPLVEVRFLNYEVTVLGEVKNPTVITVPSERISMLKAIGLAGDLTIYGKRKNVLLIREENGNRTTRHVDLTSADFLNSPYYYLEPNDVVYVQPNNARAAQSSMWPQLVPILLTGFSVAIIVLDRVLR